MKVVTLTFNNFAENTYIVYDPATLECAIIDPGMLSEAERRKCDAEISNRGLKPVHLINTHMHIDHLMGNSHIADKYRLPVEANREDEFLGKRVAEQAAMFGLPISIGTTPVGVYLEAGDIVNVGEGSLKVIHVPGHSPGSIALYDEHDRFVITGDALFAGSIGRTDLPGGSHSSLIEAISSRLFTLPDDITVYPGHGPTTTIGSEKRFNPYF